MSILKTFTQAILGLIMLSVVAQAFSADDDLVNTTDIQLPTSYLYNMYSGYLNASANSTSTKQFHYVFYPAQSSSADQLPLLLWLNGGPGCSSMLGAFTEMGPFVFKDGSINLTTNEWSWVGLANMVFIESPCAVGFSYCSGDGSDTADDDTTAEDNLRALVNFFEKFPAFKENDFYVSGESYGGIYVPYLAYAIHQWNLASTTPVEQQINLQGWIVGNGVTNWDYDCDKADIDWLYGHAMYSPQTREKVEARCVDSDGPDAGNLLDSDHGACRYFVQDVEGPLFAPGVDGVNIYDLTGVCYTGAGETSSTYDPFPGLTRRLKRKAATEESAAKLLHFMGASADKDDPVTPECLDGSGVNTYFNNDTIRASLHIPDSLDDVEWGECASTHVLHYNEEDSIGSFWIYKELIPLNKYKILIYSGDTDASVPTLGTQRWLDRLRVELEGQFYLESTWAPWLVASETPYNNQLGGYATVYNGLTFVTVKGAGHMAPQWRPYQSFVMVHYFLFDVPFSYVPV